ncbi:MAG TPA: carboxypeptidase regulatory-like domain-containing protein, partial [Gemmatimonadaceae bacterium]|nr:carboxypeptidase regulatory-like domain-containing protein [Gemmatimonadaceae bacterium]
WNMLLPAVEVTVPDTTTMSRIGVPRPRSSRVVQFRETGGLVESASWPDGTRVSEPLGTVTGVVADDDGHHPMSGVSVGLLGTALATTTDSSGAYTLGPVLPGRYTLVAADSTRVPVDDRAQARRTIDVGNDTLRVTPMVLRARQPLLRNPL